MACRLLLIHPDGAGPTGSPPLGPLYLAAEALRAGVEVRVLDLAATHGPGNGSKGADRVLAEVDGWSPHAVGVSIFSENALAAYRIAERLQGCDELLRIAGGPHATLCAEEVLDHGFDLAVLGEGEEALVEVLGALGAGRDLGTVAGIALRRPDGRVIRTAERTLLRELDRLALPTTALGLFPRSWYLGDDPSRSLPPTLLSSRGCPAHCIFCAMDHLGPKHRRHSTDRVLQEMQAWYDLESVPVFSFCDAAFTVQEKRLLALCEAMATLPFRPMWWCETRADGVRPHAAEAMANAGCLMVILGIESGDSGVSARIGKGLDLDAAADTIAMLDGLGIRVHVNFMFGFPDETAAEIDQTLRYMERIAPHVHFFNPMGLVVPYPGTPLYDRHHEELGCTRWWLDESRVRAMNRDPGPQPQTDPGEAMAAFANAREQGMLEACLVPHDAEVEAAIQRCLAFRQDFNRDKVRSLIGAASAGASVDS